MEGGNLRDAVATSVGEKHAILKQRDKLVRAALGLHMKKQTELSDAIDLRGTCPDMCPEMERYIREDRNQLSIFERLPDSETGGVALIDHRLAVKEYSRSSADQDLPLPHELRPGPVLQTTMHYLLNNIADRGGDGRWGDWFDFLWNRSRGIRKDITQQQLCDLTAVELVEKCARFHIYCGERLCEEDMMCFDEKINNENLTKCLQTLKEFYHDLAKKQIFCPNEAEFRAYMVLMNLNSGDILREVQQLRAELRQSPMIGFVVRVYSALNSNNFHRFFKLVRAGGFLNACIMHRYFYQVRIKAFHILTRAYNKKEPCPISDLTRTLAFDNDAETLEFCRSHGLSTDGTFVSLDRAAFVEPEVSYGPRRARALIESMQIGSVGETINGGALPPNVISDPQQVSFDENGRYIGNDLVNLPTAPVQRAGRSTPEPPSLFHKTEPGNQRGERRTPEPQRLMSEEKVTDQVNLVYFDLETTGLARRSHITQLAAKSGEGSLSLYVMPKEPISKNASEITGITVEGTTMYHHGNRVEAVTISEALKSLLNFLSGHAPCVLVAHNAKNFDCKVLYNALEGNGLLETAGGTIRGFVDTLPYFKERYPGLQSYKQEALMKTFLGDSVQTHDALDDVTALKSLVEIEQVPLSEVLDFSFTFATLGEIMKLDKRKASFNPMLNAGALSQYMATKLAASGISIDEVKSAFEANGNDGVEMLLSEQIKDEPRVTKNKVVIGKICEFLLKSGSSGPIGRPARSYTPDASVFSRIKQETRDRLSPDPFRSRASPVDTGRASPYSQETPVPNEIVKDIAKGLFIEVINEFTETVSTQLVKAVKLYLDYDKPVTSQFIDSVLKEEIRSVAMTARLECETEAEEVRARARAEYSMRRRKAEEAIAEELCHQEIASQIRRIAEQQCKINEENLKEQSLIRCTEQETNALLSEVLHDVTQEIADDVFAHDVSEKLEELEANARAVERMITARYFRRWKNQHAARIRLNKAMQTFPAAPCMLSARRQFDNLVPRSEGTNPRGVDLGNKRARITLESPLQLSVKRIKLEQHMALRDYWREIRRELASAPLDVPNIVHQQLMTQRKTRSVLGDATHFAAYSRRISSFTSDCKIHFKLLVCTNDDAASRGNRNWLTSKLAKGAVPNPPIHGLTRYLSLYSVRIDNTAIGVCANTIQGTPTIEQATRLCKSSFLNSVHALLFLVSSDAMALQTWTEDKRRLFSILKNVQNLSPPALAILCPDTTVSSADIERNLDLHSFMAQGLIVSYTLHFMKSSWDQPAASKTLLSALRSLVTHPREHYVMESLVLRELVEHSLHKHFYGVVYEHQAKIPQANDWAPQDLADLYNNVIEHLGQMITTEQQHPSEFMEDTQTNVTDYFRALLLPDVNGEVEEEQSAQDVYRYVQQTASEFSRNKAVLYNRVSRVMHGWRRQAECDVFSEHSQPPWIQVIMACVEFRLSELATKLQKREDERGEEVLVHVRREVLHSFKPPPLPLNMDVIYAPQPKQAAPVLTRARLERHTRESGHFDPISLRGIRQDGDAINLRNVSKFGNDIEHVMSHHSIASSLICNASQDTTQISVTSSQILDQHKNNMAALVERSNNISSPVSLDSPNDSTPVAEFTLQPTSPEKALDDVSAQFDWAVSREKNSNEQFEKYLQAMLNDECVSLSADTTAF